MELLQVKKKNGIFSLLYKTTRESTKLCLAVICDVWCFLLQFWVFWGGFFFLILFVCLYLQKINVQMFLDTYSSFASVQHHSESERLRSTCNQSTKCLLDNSSISTDSKATRQGNIIHFTTSLCFVCFLKEHLSSSWYSLFSISIIISCHTSLDFRLRDIRLWTANKC